MDIVDTKALTRRFGTLVAVDARIWPTFTRDIPRRERERRIQDALALMDLGEAGDRMVHTYSGSMIRRLEIAQSVLHRPRVLFLDEPTIGLDPIARSAVWEHLRSLRDDDRRASLSASGDATRNRTPQERMRYVAVR